MAVDINLLTATASDVQALLTAGSITSQELVKLYVDQIAKYDGYLKAVIAVTPEHLLHKAAAKLDDERTNGNVRGPLHGIPILIKDNVDTVPSLGLPTTCGSLALVGSKPRKNAPIIDRLLDAGAIMLGKANLSEWAWYRADLASSGWSAVGGQSQSAYVRGGLAEDDTCNGHSNCSGSSSGSAVAVSAGFSPVSIGTDTCGSLTSPSGRAALYTIKPTLKLVPQEGIIPITPEADSAGPMTKSVLDLANLLDVLVDPSKTTIPEGGYKSAVTGSWGDIRIGILDPEQWSLPPSYIKYEKQATDQMMRDWNAAVQKLKTLVKVVKPVTLIKPSEANGNGKKDVWKAYEARFKGLVEEYLATVDDCQVRTLEDLIKFNKDHAEEEFTQQTNNQAVFIRALEAKMTDEDYDMLISHSRESCGKRGIDKTLKENDVDVILSIGDSFLIGTVAGAGYPVATLPLSYLDFNGRPFGLQITTTAHGEALLIQAQSAWEATFPKRQPPLLDEICK